MNNTNEPDLFRRISDAFVTYHTLQDWLVNKTDDAKIKSLLRESMQQLEEEFPELKEPEVCI